MAKVDYFYDAQVERVIKHLIRLFGGFQVLATYDDSGEPVYRRVPCRYADISRQTGYILNDNSENTLQSAPFMTISIGSLQMSRNQIRSPDVENVVMGIDAVDPKTGKRTSELDAIYEVQRMNPIPWDLEFNVDIWTTNITNKFELSEQIATLFNPSVDIQLSTNPLDWTSKMIIENTGYTYSSRQVPQGTEYALDIAQFTFKTTMWMSLPVKVTRAKLIHQIVTNIQDLSAEGILTGNFATDVYAPQNHQIGLESVGSETTTAYSVTLLSRFGVPLSDTGKVFSWETLLMYYNGEANPANVELRLMESLDEIGIVSSLTVPNPETEPNIAHIEIDQNTLPATTLDNIKGIIDPRVKFRDAGSYIFHESLDAFDLKLWNDHQNKKNNPNLVVVPGSIVKLDISSNTWIIDWVFGADKPEIVINEASWKRYKYTKELGWHELIRTKYTPGFWRLGFPL